MIYSNNDNHPIIRSLKDKGWVVFEVTYARPSYKNGISGGWWIDCAVAYETNHRDSHKLINDKFLGTTLKSSLALVKSNKFPENK